MSALDYLQSIRDWESGAFCYSVADALAAAPFLRRAAEQHGIVADADIPESQFRAVCDTAIELARGES